MNSKAVVEDLEMLYRDCSERRMSEMSKWAAEMLYYACNNFMDQDVLNSSTSMAYEAESFSNNRDASIIKYMVHSLFDNLEFERAAKYCENSQNALLQFLHVYGLYLAGEKKRLDSMADVLDKQLQFENQSLGVLQDQLKNLNLNDRGDPFLLYVYGVVLNDQRLPDEAEHAFVNSIKLMPRFWPSWYELSKLVANKEKLQSLILPDHWMKQLFLGEVYQRLQMLREAIQIYEELAAQDVFKFCPYIKTQLAVVHHNLQDPDTVVDIFKDILAKDELRMEHMDTYSNSLFVKTMVAELTSLAHHCFDVNKYCPETCSVLGNYYSVRGEHDKAILYFQRSIKLNPNNSGAYTLMGHEFMEFKNTSAACLAYRKALDIDPKDFRAWYGLGQVYDILKMSHYATYYYNMAHKVRPQDSRMIIALGDMYEKHQKLDEARRCFWKAHCVGDMEGFALLRLGRLYEKLNDPDQAATSYTMYLQHLEDQKTNDPEHQPGCYRFLADYYITKNRLDEAYNYAQMCLEFDMTKEEAKGLLKRISQMRGDGKPTELFT